MKYILLICLPFLTACSVLTPGEFEFAVVIEDVRNTANGTLLTFSIDSDGESVSVAGAAYGRDSLAPVFRNQVEASVDSSGLFRVLFPNIDDGLYYFQAYAGFDGFYALSDVTSFTVVSSVPTATCQPLLGRYSINGYECDIPQSRVATGGGSRSFGLGANCDFINMTVTFPREPTSGVYLTQARTTVADAGSQKFVHIYILTGQGFEQYTARDRQEVYVERQDDRTLITFCDIDCGQRNQPLNGRIAFSR